MPTISEDQLDRWFRYHPPHGTQAARYERIRNAARIFANAIVENSQPSADQTAAIRKVREAVMTVNAGIATEEA